MGQPTGGPETFVQGRLHRAQDGLLRQPSALLSRLPTGFGTFGKAVVRRQNHRIPLPPYPIVQEAKEARQLPVQPKQHVQHLHAQGAEEMLDGVCGRKAHDQKVRPTTAPESLAFHRRPGDLEGKLIGEGRSPQDRRKPG